MNSQVVQTSASSALVIAAGGKRVRMSKKDFFIQECSGLGRSAKEAAFARYAEQYSAEEAAGIAGMAAAGLIRFTSNKVRASGKTGAIGYEFTQARRSATERLEQAVRDAEAEAATKAKENETLLAKIAELEAANGQLTEDVTRMSETVAV